MADRPIYAESADGMLHEFPSGTDASVIDGAMKQYAVSTAPKSDAAPAPTPAAEPPSGNLKGIAKAAGQGAIETGGRVVSGMGAAYQSAATGLTALETAGQEAVKRQADIMDRIDQGATMRDFGDAPNLDRLFAREYQVSSEDRRAKMREGIDAQIAALPKVEDTNAGKAASIVKGLGEDVSAAGHRIGEFAQKTIPLTEEEQGRFSVHVTKALTGLAAYVGAATVGGMPALIGLGGVEAMGTTYDEAKKAGASDENAAGAAAISGVVQGGLNAVPIHKSMQVMDQIPKAFKGEFIKTITEMAKSAGTLVAFGEVAKVAENATAKGTYDPSRDLLQGVGNLREMGVSAVAGAILPAAGAAVRATAGRVLPSPRAATEPDPKIVNAPDVDQAITAAREAVDRPAIEETAAQAREFGNPADQDQASILKLFGGLNQGTVERATDGTYHYNDGERTFPLKPWDGAQRPDTIPAALADAQRDHYGRMGVRVIYLENDRAIPFDGAVDPAQPDTIFLSNNPQRNAAQVGAHEITHVLESTTLPDGTHLGDLLQQQVAAGITPEGRAYAERLFGQTAPERRTFPEGPEGDSLHADAVTAHLIRELGADIGSEAPKFQTFLPRVVDAVQQRYGQTTAGEVLQKLIAGIQQAMQTLRKFFFRPEEGAEYGQPPTVSQHWVTNLEAIHDTLAKMYAERFRPVEPPAVEAKPAAELAPPKAPEVPASPAVEITPEAKRANEIAAPEATKEINQEPARIGPEPGPGYEDARTRAETMTRWLGELDAERRQAADASPQARLLRQTEAVILGKVKGVEARLTVAARGRLETVRAQLHDLLNPQGDSPDMARVRESLVAEHQRMADAAAVGSPSPSMERAGAAEPEPKAATEPQPRGRAVMEAPPSAAEPPATARAAPAREQPKTETSPAAASYARAVEAERERLWAEDMGRHARGLTRNERAVTDSARENVMRREAGFAIDYAKEVYGLPEDAVHEIARYYRRAEGESPEAALERAANRWFDQTEIEAARIFGVGDDVLNHDFLKSEGDPALREIYDRIDEHYTGGHVDHDAIPFEQRPPRESDVGDRGEAARPEGTEGGRAGAQAGDRGQHAPEDAAAGGPVGADEPVAFSPRRVDSEPPGPKLLETREATPEELAARKRAVEKEVAEARMRGRKAAKVGQESADETPLFGGPRQGTLLSPRITSENTTRQYTPEEKQFFERVGRATESTTLRDKIDEARDDIGRKVVRETLDAYIGIKENDPEGYMAARMANSVGGAQEVFRLYGTLKFNGSTYDYKDLNGGVRGLVKALGPEAGDFMWWVAAHRAERLKAEDRENLFTAEDIAAGKQLNRGEVENEYRMPNGTVTRRREAVYADALRRLDAFNKNALDLGVESGLLKRDNVDALWSNPFYVPFYREAEASGSKAFVGASSALVRQNAFKSLKGGSEKLNNDLWENALGNWDHMIDAALRNRAAAQILETASRPALGAAEKVTTQDYDHRMTKAEKAETVWAMVDGEKEYWRVTDPMVFKAVSALEAASTPGPIMNVARWFSRALRYGVTANPLFAVRNLIRDTENTIAVSQISKNPLKNLADGFGQIDVGDRLKNLARAMAAQETDAAGLAPEAVSAMAGGALMRMGSASDSGIAKTSILDSQGKLQAFGRYIADVAGAYKETLASGEDVNRLALYKQLREEGAPHDFAAFSGRDLQDFTLRGASPFVRTITDITPFLGARLQGLYKLGRAASDADKSVTAAVASKVARSVAIRAATVMGAMTLAGLALDAIYHDDEDYKKRTEYDRQTYYWFKIGEAQFRVPKGFELAALSSLASDGIEAFFDKEMTGRRMINNFWTSLSTNLQVQAPAAVQPIIDLATNTRGTGGPIESTSMQRLEPQERYTADSTLAARGMSAAINAVLGVVAPRADGPSPVQLDYLTNGYGGWLATSVMGMADTVARSLSSEPEKPAGDFWAKATQGLVRTESAPQSRYVDMLYEQGKQIEEAHATFLNLAKLGRGEDAKAFALDRKDELAKYPAFERVKRMEGEINQQVRVITNDANLSAEQKKIKILQLNALKNRAAEGLFATP